MHEVEARAQRLLKEAQDEMTALEGKPRTSTRRLHLTLRMMVLEEVLGIPSPFAEPPTLAEVNAARTDAWRERKEQS